MNEILEESAREARPVTELSFDRETLQQLSDGAAEKYTIALKENNPGDFFTGTEDCDCVSWGY